MSILNVKQGDEWASWSLGDNLTGATAQILARLRDTVLVIELTTEITDDETGVVRAVVDGLAVGTYDVEATITRAGVTVRYPDYGFEQLSVNPRLTLT